MNMVTSKIEDGSKIENFIENKNHQNESSHLSRGFEVSGNVLKEMI
jgi:hypothetical protein